jgi:predicted nucleic acid-binding Zn ribbon protein
MCGGWRKPGEGEDFDEVTPPRLAQVVDDWLAVEGLTELKALGKVRQTWPEVVGEDIARHAAPVSLQEGRLVVAVDHSAWATELRFLEKRICRSVDAQLGEGVVTRLEVRVRRTDGVE